ncbi:transcription factor SOX-30 isoform X3 [Clarias magur]|uniref:Transcription factor SOX-30 isoform X3 n=1 Tax=Clarias magur TaxID=1594786 RepID=A0A8J4TZP9_CLAMG|nr:transcription factor SOX-30 isoform X3 [Clarias magur]
MMRKEDSQDFTQFAVSTRGDQLITIEAATERVSLTQLPSVTDWEYKPRPQKRKQVCLDKAAPGTSTIQNNLIFSVSLEKTASPRRPDREPTPPHFPDDLLPCMSEPLFTQTSTLDFRETSIGMDLYDNSFLDYDDFSALDQYLFGQESVADSKDTSSRDTHLSAGLKYPPVLDTNALEEGSVQSQNGEQEEDTCLKCFIFCTDSGFTCYTISLNMRVVGP